MAKHNQTGQWGEQIALETLIKKGYAIVERNWRLNHLEVDIIAMRQNRLVFVEVKTRSSLDANPAEAVDRRKIRHMVAAADNYVRISNLPHEIQFDIIAVSGKPDNYVVDHIEDAFLPPLRTVR
ncbi:MAG: YraN family protein [Muribaculaceae bacterium]|nr:YraN family protein [Muribaculaceae bacterium]